MALEAAPDGIDTDPLVIEINGSVTDVAVMVMFPAVVGGVYVVAAAVNVMVGLNVPHDPAGEQLQLTPAVSLVVTEGLAVVPCGTTLGGAVAKVTVIPVM